MSKGTSSSSLKASCARAIQPACDAGPGFRCRKRPKPASVITDAEQPLTALAGRIGQRQPPLAATIRQAAPISDRAVELDQYYTCEHVAVHFYEAFKKLYDPAQFLMIEPSAGTGAFFKLLPPSSLGYDIEPKYLGIQLADFLEVELPRDRNIAIIGNPPFGRNASSARKFFKHGSRRAKVIAMILPKTFRKASVVNSLNSSFHLVYEEEVPANAFLFRGKPYNVRAVFQIWERRDEPRAPILVATKHADFEFIKTGKPDFVIQRVGARAGRIHHDTNASLSSHYFIKAKKPGVKKIMMRLRKVFGSAALNVAGNPSLAKSEIVSLYSKLVGRRTRP